MNRPLSLVLVCGGFATALAFAAMRQVDAAQDAKQQPGAGNQLKIEGKKEKAPPIPDFAKAYGVPFESFLTVGRRLGEARDKFDPIALALIAVELNLGERVSGKKAEVTAEDVQKEAVALATMRRLEPELTAMAMMVKDDATATKLTDLAKQAGREESERIAKFKSGEHERGIHVLVVRNHLPVPFSIRLNGIHLGWVQGNSQMTFNTSQFYEPHEIFLSAHDQFGDRIRAEAHTGHHHFFTWDLNDN
jgi:hypothetical protein